MERKTNKEVLIVIASVLIVVLIAYLSIFPTIDNLRDTNYDLSLKKQDLENSEEYLENLKLLEAEFNSEEKKLGALQESMPEREDVESLLVMMERASAKNGLFMSGFTPLNFDEDGGEGEFGEASIMTESGLGIEEANFEMGLMGSYGALKKFLAQIERSRRAVNVTALTISGSATTASAESLNITLQFKTYYLKQS